MALSDLDNIPAQLIAQETSGSLIPRMLNTQLLNTTTGATSASNGGLTIQRFPNTFTVPSVGAGYTGWMLTAEIFGDSTWGNVAAALEYNLGTLALSTNVFTSGVSMPTKTTRINSTTYSSQQTASAFTALVATANLTAVTPTITITYTNEDGTGSRTASPVLPTNVSVNSGFYLGPQLQTPDVGVRSCSNMSRSAGTAGTLALMGLIPIGYSNVVSAGGTSVNNLLKPIAPVIAVENDVVAFYHIGTSAIKNINVTIRGVPI